MKFPVLANIIQTYATKLTECVYMTFSVNLDSYVNLIQLDNIWFIKLPHTHRLYKNPHDKLS